MEAPPATAKPAVRTTRRESAGESPSQRVARVIARANIGFGNTLFIRGEGEVLSWEHGIAMENKGSDEWVCELSNLKKPVEFKLLINDETWSQNENFTLTPGQDLTCEPTF